MSSDQWQALTLIDGVSYADDLACAFTDAHKIASSYSLIDKYSNLPSNAINPSWVISKNKDIFIVEATGIDVI
ncbi:hypothetical protein [Colwellia sp. E150_009]